MDTNVLMIGGDSRNIEIIHTLHKQGNIIYLAGFEKLDIDLPNVFLIELPVADISKMDAIILPVHGTSESGEITSSYSDQPIILTAEIIAKTPKHCVIYTGITNDYLTNITKHRKTEVIFARDDIAIYNSISTAEATLQLAMEHTDYTIHGAEIAILGFGRVGMTVARLFHNVGAKVTVFVRKSADIARITEFGMIAAEMSALKNQIDNYAICINSIPHLILDSLILDAMQQDTLIIDIASKPGGTDFKYAEQIGLKAIHALGLPGKVAPKSAGEILASTILSLMKKNQK